MPDIASHNGIAVADIASINGQDVPSGGGGVSEPTSGFLTLGGSIPGNSILRFGANNNDTFESVTFHSSVSSVPATSAITKVSSGRYMVGMLDSSGNLYMSAVGNQETGSASIYGGHYRQFSIELTSVADFSFGKDHGLAVKTDGTLWGIGGNGDGELGRGNTSSQYSTFAEVGGGATNWSKVSCGEDFSLALKTTGALYSAGKNQDGRTGQGTTSGDTTSWTQIGSDTNWTQISTGEKHSAGILSGKLITWGDGSSRRLGNNSYSDETSPYTANSDTDWQSVHCGTAYTKAIKTTDGHHYHAGSGGAFGSGTRGDGSTSSTTTFTRIGSDTGWTEFLEFKYSSFSNYAAGKKSGSWYVCGNYQLAPYIKTGGTATESNTTTFVQLASPSPSFFSLAQYSGAQPEALYIV
tara:strand:+ start:1597 stop:2826 length:1230 start_codon:yes stop_codon:yes gene_type:complete